MASEMKVTFPGGKRIDAEYKGFLIRTDQPVYHGGEGTAPAPFDLFLVSIATCSALYVLAFCEKRGISLKNSYLNMKREHDPATKRISKLIMEIFLPADFPEKYKQAVIKSVNSCSVKIHMEYPPEFEVVVFIES